MKLKRIALGALVGAGVGFAYRRFASPQTPTMGDFGARDDDSPGTGGPDDARLTEKVKTELFRDPDVPKGQINVNTEYGKVILRGQVENDDMVERLVEAARNVQGVTGVENMLQVGGSTGSTASDGTER